MNSKKTPGKRIFEDKLLNQLIIVICSIGLIIGCSKIFLPTEFHIIFIFIELMLALFGMMPYIIYSILSLLCNSKWIALLIGIILLVLDLIIHGTVFYYASCGKASTNGIVFIFSPIYFSIICVVLFVILFTPQILITKYILKRG